MAIQEVASRRKNEIASIAPQASILCRRRRSHWASGPTQATDDIVIGASMPMTGVFAFAGIALNNAFQVM